MPKDTVTDMFRARPHESIPSWTYQLAVIGVWLMAWPALAVTAWIMDDFLREQIIVAELMKQLPKSATDEAAALAGELRLQFRLTILVVLNLVATGLAIVLLWWAYSISQESLRETRALAGDILNSIEQAIITTDLEGKITSINRRGMEMAGLDSACVGVSLREVSQTIPLSALQQEATQEDSRQLARDVSVSLGGANRILRVFCEPLRNDREHQFGSVLQLLDVTEQTHIEDRMRRMERYMQLGSLAGGLHHEIKNPLAALSLHIQLLEELFDSQSSRENQDGHDPSRHDSNRHSDSAEISELLGVVRHEVQRIGGVLESFRDYASLGSLNRSDVDLQELVGRQVRLVRPQTHRSSIKVHVECPSGLVPSVNADSGRIEQVILNVLVNAMEAMPEGGTLTIRLSKEDISDQEGVRIEISDTGHGIPDDLRGRIFDPYFSTKSNGTGMGLALSEKIVRQHNGVLDIDSSPAGTNVIVWLPVKASSPISDGVQYE